MTEPACFTIAELAARWKCGERGVRSAIKDGRIKSFRIGTRERVTMTEVKRYEGEEGNHETGEERALAALDRLRPEIRH